MRMRVQQGGKPRGFTLIELMIVVVILGVLAAVAILSYRVYVRRARVSEATGLLAAIKASQESYRSEFGMYCNVNSPAPVGDPGPRPHRWDPAAVSDHWTQLGFRPDSQYIYFQLDTIAGLPGDASVSGWLGDADSVQLPVAQATFVQDHWFVARALGDQDGDGVHSVFWVTSREANVSYRREVE